MPCIKAIYTVIIGFQVKDKIGSCHLNAYEIEKSLNIKKKKKVSFLKSKKLANI